MSSIQTVQVDRFVPETVSGPVVGGLVSTLLALLSVFVASLSGVVGVGLYLVVWPLVGGAVAAAVESGRGHDASLAGVLAGAYGAIVFAVVVLLTGVAGLWTPAVHATFGVSLWPVVFTVLVVTTIGWTVFALAGGYAVLELAGE